MSSYAFVCLHVYHLLTISSFMQTGLKLVLDSSDEDFLVAMLTSLSKLAYKSTLLISEQVHFPFIYDDLCVLLRGFQDGYCIYATVNIAKRLHLDALDCPFQLLDRPKSHRLTAFCLDFEVCSLCVYTF